ncbi:hypothetical protein BGZ81_002849, partial [Podila clonocystis]
MTYRLDDVMQHDLGLDFLLDGRRQFTAEAFKMLALFNEFEFFFYAPTAAIKFTE